LNSGGEDAENATELRIEVDLIGRKDRAPIWSGVAFPASSCHFSCDEIPTVRANGAFDAGLFLWSMKELSKLAEVTASVSG